VRGTRLALQCSASRQNVEPVSWRDWL
jgi:hypothetical protein